MVIGTVISLVLSVVAILISVLAVVYAKRSFHYTRRQTEIMEGQIRKQESQDKEELDWSERFERLANQLVRTNPGLTIQPPGYQASIVLYPSIFPDAKFREALETYIVQCNGGRTQFSQRNPRPDELRRANLRETIKKAEQYMADFQKSNPQVKLEVLHGLIPPTPWKDSLSRRAI